MAQLFPRYANKYARASVVIVHVVIGLVAGGWWLYYWGPYATGQKVFRPQPVQFTHEHHVAGLGLDCRYCHINAENSSFAGIPPVKVCMNCHSQLWTDADILEPIRNAYKTDKPIQWTRVHNLADFVYFNHSVHVNKGIGCATCHGRVDQMPLMQQVNSLRMGWCLQCHRHPEQFVQSKQTVFNMDAPTTGGMDLVKAHKIESKTYCSTCHR